MPIRRPIPSPDDTRGNDRPKVRPYFYRAVGGGTTVPPEPVGEDFEKRRLLQAPCPTPEIVAPLWVVQLFQSKKSVYEVGLQIRDRLLAADPSITFQQVRCLINDLARNPVNADAIHKLLTPETIARLLARRK